MKHSDKDKFEQFFQDNLKDYNSSPSDDLWSELEHRIPPPPKSSSSRKVGGWLFFLIGIVLLFSIIQFWNYETEIETINQTLEKQEQKITSISNDLKNSIAKKSDEIIDKASDNLSEGTEIVDSKKNEILSSKKISKSSSSFTNNSFEEDMLEEIQDVNILLNAGTITTRNENSFSSEIKDIKPKVDFVTIEEVGEINPLKLFLDTSTDLEKFDRPVYKLLDFKYPKTRNGSFELFRNYSWVYPKLTFENEGIPSTSLPSRNIDIGIFYGVKLTNRIILQFGVSYGKEYTGLQFRKFLDYAENEILVDNDLTQTKYRYQFNTNYGRQIFDSFILNEKENDGQDVVAGDDFFMDIEVIRRQQYLTVPVVLKYFWSNPDKRLSGSLKFGVFQKFNFLEDQLAEISVNNISKSRLSYERTTIRQVGNATVRDVSFILGTGFEYKFDSQLILVFEPNLKKSIFGFNGASPYTLGFYTGLRWNIFQ